MYIKLQNKSLFQKKNPKPQIKTKHVYLNSSLFSKVFKHTKVPLELQDILKCLTNTNELKQMLKIKCFVETEFSDAIPTL